MTTTDSNSTHPVAQRLRQAGITSVVIIDDAFNTPVFGDLGDEIEDFWAEIDREESALTELKALKEGFESEDDIDEELINVLWARTLNEEPSSLLLPCKSILFSQQLENLSDLTPLVGYLRRIGITPIPLGTDDDLPNEQLKLFFLDFVLEPATGPPGFGEIETAIREFVDGKAEVPSIQASIDKARQILDEFKDAFIVLMSSRDSAQMARDKFRQKTGLIEGMFDYCPKEQLASEKDLNLNLGISAASLPVRHDIQRFVDAFRSSITKASEEFDNRIKSLSFEDYMYIYSLSLRAEGQPLGDYMSWLYKSLLAHLVHNHDQVLEAQDKLDDINMEAYVPLKRPPPSHLADMYSLSLTEPGTSSNKARLRLGDLYVNRARDVLLVINADCDLVHSPQSSNRRIPDDRSILLHPGRLIPFDKKPDREFKVTNLFFYEKEPVKIVWDHEGVITKKYGEVKGWLDSKGYSKKARLITPHALEIQQNFAAKLTRVGMPVAPPFPRPATVQVFGKNEDETLKKLGGDIPQGVVLDQQGFRFTKEGFSEILDMVDKGISHYKEIRDSCGVRQGRYVKLGEKIRKLEELLQNCEKWFEILNESKKMPNQNGRPIGPDDIFKVFYRSKLERAECIIAINILPDE